jgi:hypothetical protein
MGVWFSSRATSGLVIADVANNSVFANAGFREGDRIVSINGRPITTEAQFVQFLTGPDLGTQQVQVIVFRDGQEQTLVLQPTALTQGLVTYDPLYQYGIVIDDSNPNQFVVLRVFPRTAAYYAGLRQGDVIVTVGDQRVTSLNVFTQALAQADGVLPLQVTRSGQTRDLQLDASLSSQSSARTALRPNLDADTRVDGRAGATAPGRTPDSATAPARTPDSATAPARRPEAAAPGAREPDSPVAAPPATPRTPAAAPGAPGSAPRQPQPAPRGTPAAPRTPATPAAPGAAPASPATPAAPATPAQPRTGGGKAPAPAPAAPGAPGAEGPAKAKGKAPPRQ